MYCTVLLDGTKSVAAATKKTKLCGKMYAQIMIQIIPQIIPITYTIFYTANIAVDNNTNCSISDNLHRTCGITPNTEVYWYK